MTMIATLPARPLLTVYDVARAFGRTRQCVYQWRHRLAFPGPVLKEGARVYFARADVVEWASANGWRVVER